MTQNEQLKEWLNKYMFDCTCKRDKYFCYSYDDECVYWTNNSTEHDHHYIEFIKKLGYNQNLDIRTLSFLHELGHHEMSDNYTAFDFFFERFKKYIEGDCRDYKQLKLRCNIYYRLPVEKKATMWMINFVDFFKDETKELDKIFRRYKLHENN